MQHAAELLPIATFLIVVVSRLPLYLNNLGPMLTGLCLLPSLYMFLYFGSTMFTLKYSFTPSQVKFSDSAGPRLEGQSKNPKIKKITETVSQSCVNPKAFVPFSKN